VLSNLSPVDNTRCCCSSCWRVSDAIVDVVVMASLSFCFVHCTLLRQMKVSIFAVRLTMLGLLVYVITHNTVPNLLKSFFFQSSNLLPIHSTPAFLSPHFRSSLLHFLFLHFSVDPKIQHCQDLRSANCSLVASNSPTANLHCLKINVTLFSCASFVRC